MSFLPLIKSPRPLLGWALLSAAALLAVLLLIGLTGGNSSAASGAEGGGANPFRLARAQETYYHWYHRNTASQERAYQAYVDLMDNYFLLQSREVGDSLEILVHPPHTIRLSSNFFRDETMDFRLREEYFFYNTVRRPQDCTFDLFNRHYNMLVTKPETSMRLPLSASDYGRYYCFKVGLRVSLPGFDLIPAKVFVVEQPVESAGRGDVLSEFPDFRRTVMRSTYYDYSNKVASDQRPNPQREAYYRHLNENFNLYTRQAFSGFHFRFSLPGHFSQPGRDINDFELKKLEYRILIDKADCDRDAFEDNVVEIANPTTAFSFEPESSQYGQFYCFKATLRGERSWSRDVHPYRIFLVPQGINSGSTTPDEVWLSL